MHSIIFAKDVLPKQDVREVRITEKVNKEGVFVYSRRRSFYQVIDNEGKIPVYETDVKPEMYIYKNIQDNRKFFRWKVRGVVKLPQGRKTASLLAYEHSFWMFIKDQPS
ncbi:MAG: hypothetical protein P9M06_04360 [Candidatus Saelkia tenebricola]|nr:hypothetical protein [Candidatus Saelkia tenebricola]